MGIKHTKVAGGVDNPAYDVSKGEWNDDHDISTLDIVDISTAETDDTLVLAPDGAGGVEFRAEAGGGGGAPTTADYLVGTANAGLSAEIAVGTTPGGELGGTWASPTVDATHSGSAHHSAVTVGTGLDVTGQLVELDLSEVAAGGELGGFMDAPTVDATHSGSTHAATQAAAESTAASALSTHAAAADPHTGYLKESVVSAMAAPGLTLGTTNAAGVATTVLATDSTILAFDATGPAAIGTQAVGAATVAARRDHVHATGAGTPSTQAFGDAAATGSGPAASMTDHKHAMPADPVTAHAAASDPHTGYVLESLLNAKGDLITASADNTPALLTVGADDTILMADAAAGGGLKWVASQTPSTQASGDSAAQGTADTYARGDHKHGMPTLVTTTLANDTLWAAAGDLVQATGNDAAAVLSAGTAGYFLKAGGAGTASAWAARELDYVEKTSATSITATTAGTANTVVTGASVAYDGSTAIIIEFMSAFVTVPAANDIAIGVFESTTIVGVICYSTVVGILPMYGRWRLTPSNASHTYNIKAYVSGGTGSVGGGAAGTAGVPTFMRITRAL